MKKIYTLLCIALTASGFAQTSESFNFSGALNANGWTNFTSGGGTAGQLVTLTTASDSGNSLSYTGLAASTGNRTAVVAGNSEDAAKNLAAPLTGVIYYSILVKAQNTTGLEANTNTSGDYIFGLSSTAAPTSPNYYSRLYVREGSVAGSTINIGVLNSSGGTAAPAFSGNLPINTTILVVQKYDLATNIATLYINPVPGAAEPTVATGTNTTGTGAAPASILSVAIRQGSATTPKTGNFEIDEIRVGNTFASVTPSNLSVAQNQIDGLKIYPNPVTNGTFYINTTADSTKEVIVYDVLGKQVIKTSTANAVNVSNLKGGVYIVKITEDGNTATRKLVIK